MGGDRVSKHYYMNQQRVATDITINYDPNGTGGGEQEQSLAKDPASAAPELSPALANFSEVLIGLGQKPLDTASLQLPTIESYYPEAAKTPATSSSAEGNPTAPRILFWYHPDYLGNVDLITERDGYTHEFFMYNPWGEEMHQWNANTYAFTSPYRFNAKELDPETGLAYYGARYYQNKIGVWLSVDPLAMHSFQIDKSPYVAFWNNPIVFNDPDGRCPDCPDPSTAKEGDIVNPNGGMDFIFKDGEWTGIGGTLDEVTVTAPSSEGIRGLGSGFVDGFGAGIGNTVDFFASLGTTQGWKDLGQGMLDMSMLGCQTCPQGMMMRTQMADRTINYIQNIPNMSAYEMGFDLGFSTEKALEIGITRNVMPISKTALGIRNVGKASRFSTIQSVNTYGKWGTFSQRQFTWPTGGYTLDKATFYNRNFIIPSGRVVGVGQFQHFQKK
jgi:RHS repeat-associated protein